MAIPGVQRNVYVPAATRAKKPVTQTEVKALPEELRFRTAAAAFRSVRWDSAAGEDLQPKIDLSEPPDPLAPARLVFAQIPWFGEKRTAPTVTQSASSVISVLASFKWE